MEALVLATNSPNRFKKWFEAWKPEIQRFRAQLFVMHDSFDTPETERMLETTADVPVMIFNHGDVQRDLKQESWIIPLKTSACKSYAIYLAWKSGAERIYCLDDDCFPEHDFFGNHKHNLRRKVFNSVWLTVNGVRPRGVPYLPEEPVMLSHGLWEEIPDVDAVTQLNGHGKHEPIDGVVPKGSLFPFCGMNWACSREAAPLMYFGLQGKNWPVDRFDDIWCGFIAKRILDHLGMAVWSGFPCIRHIKASDPLVNLEKEAPGYRMNIQFYEYLSGVHIQGLTPAQCMENVGPSIKNWGDSLCMRGETRGDYWAKYGQAIQIWAMLFEKKDE